MSREVMTFKEAYGVLQTHAETLRNQTEPNIDDLLSIVEESVSAYRVCKERIDAVEKALERALTDVSNETPAAAMDSRGGVVAPGRAPRNSTAGASKPPAAASHEGDEDIPF